MILPCGCCEGLAAITPAPISNPPGLSAIAYRVGTHATFLATMEAALSAGGGGPGDQLARLRTRETSDLSIGLLDAWATVADVLTFYQERIANEGFLHTATERASIQELARLIGYSLRPGVASSVFLASTLEKDGAVRLEVGNRAQSVPAPLLDGLGDPARPWTEFLDTMRASIALYLLETKGNEAKSKATALDAVTDTDPDVVAMKDALATLKTLRTDTDPFTFASVVQAAYEALQIGRTRLARAGKVVPSQVAGLLEALPSLGRDLPPSALRGAVSALLDAYADPAKVIAGLVLSPDGTTAVEGVKAAYPDDIEAGVTLDALRARLLDRRLLARLDELPNATGDDQTRKLAEWAGQFRAAINALVEGLGAAPIREKLREIVARYQDESGPGIPPDTEIAGRVLRTILDDLDKKLGAGGGSVEQIKLVRAAIGQLRTELSIAGSGGYPRLEPWLAGLVGELEDAVQAMGADEAAPAAPAGTTDAPPAGPSPGEASEDAARQTQNKVIKQLLTIPSSRPPANELRLSRDPRALVASASALASSDVVPQLLVNLDRRLAPTLYPALSNAEVNPSTAPGSAFALRVKAAPFGAAANLRLVFGEGEQKNVVVDHEEWPLQEATIHVGIHDIPFDISRLIHLAELTLEFIVRRGDSESAKAVSKSLGRLAFKNRRRIA